MTSPTTIFNLYDTGVFVLPIWIIVLPIAIYSQRERFNRSPYSRTEKFALLSIATLGILAAPFSYFFFPYLCLCILAFGKKIKEVEPDCQE